MEAETAVYAAVLAFYLADTGAGGLNNTSSAAYVRKFTREGDPRERQTHGWPQVSVSIKSRDNSPFPGAAETKGFFECIVAFVVEVDRDPGFPKLAAVQNRLRDRFNNAALADLVDADNAARTWKFRPCWRMDPGQLRDAESPNGKVLRQAFPFYVAATKETP